MNIRGNHFGGVGIDLVCIILNLPIIDDSCTACLEQDEACTLGDSGLGDLLNHGQHLLAVPEFLLPLPLALGALKGVHGKGFEMRVLGWRGYRWRGLEMLLDLRMLLDLGHAGRLGVWRWRRVLAGLSILLGLGIVRLVHGVLLLLVLLWLDSELAHRRYDDLRVSMVEESAGT